MKTRFNYLTLILSLSIFSLTLFSCKKEPLHNFDPKVVTESDHSSGDKDLPNFDIDFDSKEAPDYNLTYAELIVDTEFQEEPKWNISIEATSCTRMGTSLNVFSESQPHIDFQDSGRFFVYWFKDGKAIESNTDQLDCVCSGNYGVVIIRKYDNKGIGKAYQKVRACHSIDLTTADDGEI